ncbi:MAG: carboxypeptidase regulatory-like domain-containing protein [Acidobacteriaceae bacterium]
MRKLSRSKSSQRPRTFNLLLLSKSLTSLAVLLLLAAAAVAQSRNSGEIRGTVVDSTGAVIPGAQITIRNVLTGVVSTFTSDKAGIYDAESLIPGTYTVSFEKDGFKKKLVNNITLHVEAITINGALEVGATSTTVSVSSEAALVQTETSDTHETLNAQVITQLPSVGNNWTDFTALLPGTNAGASQSSNVANFNGGGSGQGVGINGQGGYLSSWTQDGGEATVAVQMDQLITPIDAIGEVNFKTSNFSAEYSNGLAVFNVITKSGTNKFHGSLYEFNQSTVFNARNNFQTTRPPVHWNNFGGSIGGPIIRNKAFFFFAYQRNPNHSSLTGLVTVPTAAQRAGDLSGSDAPGISLPVIYDPATTTPTGGGGYARTPFAGNIIPSGRINPAALAVLKYYPLPNHAASSGSYNSNNYYYDVPIPLTTTTYTAKFDYNFSQSNRLNGSSMHVVQPGPWGSWDTPIDNIQGYIHEDTNQVSDVWTINPNTVNEARIVATQEIGTWNTQEYGQGWSGKLGIPDLTYDYFPGINPSGITAIGTSFRSGIDDAVRWVFADSVTLVRGKHILKFGGEYDRWGDTSCWTCHNAGSFNFSGVFTEQPNSPTGTGNGFADFLLGQSNNWSDSWALTQYGRLKNFQLYAQDDYKIRKNLTLNIGLRYYVPFGWTEKKNNFGGFDPTLVNPGTGTLGAMWYAPTDGNGSRTALQNTIWTGLGPRLGFAYSPRPDWSIRAAYGIFDQGLDVGNYNIGIGVATNPNGSDTTTDSITPVALLSSGHAAPAIPTFPPSAAQYNGTSVPYMPRSIRMMYLQQWNATVEHEFPGQLLLSVGYVANKGTHVISSRDINQIPLSTVQQVWAPGVDMQQYRPYPQYQGITYAGTNGWSSFNSLQVTFKKAVTHGLWLTSNYTWGHALDTGSVNGWTGGQGPIQNQASTASNYGNADSDTRQSWNGGWTYDLPVGRGRTFLGQGGPLDYVIGGWGLSGTWNKSTGRPFTPEMGGTNTDYTLSGSLLPNRTCNGKIGNANVNHWFDYNCFSAPALLNFGNSGRNILYGPGYDMLNASLGKKFHVPYLGENANLQIRADFTDLPNFKNYGLPNNSITPQPAPPAPPVATSAGIISSALSSRTGQIGARLTF